MLLCTLIEGPPSNNPPAGPIVGQSFLVGDSPVGDWAGHAGEIAGFTDGGWRFVAPPDGTQLLNRATGEAMVRRNAAWEIGVAHVQEIQVDGRKVLGAQQPSILAPAGGSVADLEARAAISEIIVSLRAHGLIGG